MNIVQLLSENLTSTMMMSSRVFGVFMFAPGFSTNGIPRKIKVMLGLMIGFLLSSYNPYNKITNIYEFFIYIGCEVVGGILIGLVSRLFLDTIQIIGGIIDSLIGTGIFQSQSMDMSLSNGVSVKIIEYMALILFFTTNSHLTILYVLCKSPSFINIYNVFLSGKMIDIVIQIFEFIFSTGIHLAMPFILILLIIDLAFGILNRSFSSFNVFLFSIPTKFIVFFFLMSYYILYFKENFTNLINTNFDIFNSIFKLLA